MHYISREKLSDEERSTFDRITGLLETLRIDCPNFYSKHQYHIDSAWGSICGTITSTDETKFVRDPSEANRMADVSGGFPWTSIKHPWPGDGKYRPVLQLNLDRFHRETGIDIGEGTLQVWVDPEYPINRFEIRVIPTEDLIEGCDPEYHALESDRSDNECIGYEYCGKWAEPQVAYYIGGLLDYCSPDDDDEPQVSDILDELRQFGDGDGYSDNDLFFTCPKHLIFERESDAHPLYDCSADRFGIPEGRIVVWVKHSGQGASRFSAEWDRDG